MNVPGEDLEKSHAYYKGNLAILSGQKVIGSVRVVSEIQLVDASAGSAGAKGA